jgi:putative peptidoglycan lipid II flippase
VPPAVAEPAPEAAREARSTAAVAAGILLSRLVGLLRQRIAAHYFGTSSLADVIAAAFRVGNITQNLLGEGALSASFIPIYARLRGQGRHEEAVRFAQASLGLLCAAVIVLSGLGVACAPWLSWVVAAGFDPDKLDTTTHLVRIVFPMTGLLVLCAWGLGVLNSHRRFFLPYAAPVIWSAVQIAALLVVGGWLLRRGQPLATALAWSALGGAALELAVLLRTARSLLGGLRLRFELRNPHVRDAIRRLPSVLMGRGVIQISGYVDTLLVSFLGTGANATFGYAQMLYLLPMSLLGTSEAAASLPEMSRDSAEQDEVRRNQSLRRRLSSALARVTLLTVPAMVALVLLGRELITVVLQTGAFDRSSTERVAEVLAVYGLALLGNASGRVLATSCYALGDTKRPARYAVVRVVASTLLALALMRSLGVVGVVIGAAVAAWLEAGLLGWRVRRVLGGLGLAELRVTRLAVLGLACAALPLGVRAILPATFAASPLGSAIVLCVLPTVFAAAAQWLGLLDLRSALRRGR